MGVAYIMNMTGEYSSFQVTKKYTATYYE